MKRRSIACIVILFILSTILLTACEANDIQIPTAMEDVYIYDQAQVIDDSIEKSLNAMLIDLEEKTGIEFAIISIESLNGHTIEDYANATFNTLGIGKADEDNGILLLFSPSDTKVRLEIGRGLEGTLTDSKCGRILDLHFVPYRDEDDYNSATEMTTKAILSIFMEEYGITIDGMDEAVLTPDLTKKEIAINIAIIILVVLLIFIYVWAMANSDNGDSGGFHGGGFYDGGSSGGFSGGFSNGAGASR